MKKEAGGRRGTKAAVTVDQNLPRLVCQNCRHALCVVGVEGDDNLSNDPSNSGLLDTSVQSNVLDSSRMDNSFVVLSKQKGQIAGNSPFRRRENRQSDGTRTGKDIEDSFVVLPPSTASIYKSNSGAEQGGSISHPGGGNTSEALHVTGASFDSTITILKHAFEIATSQMQVKQPLCLECICVLSDKLEKEVEDVNRDTKAYETYLNSIEGESRDVLSDADFQEEKLKLEEEERRLVASIEDTEKRCAKINLELKELDSKAVHFKELEERYWHEFNDFQFQLTTHQEERDAILAKAEVSQTHLELLKRTNVLNDAFPIFHDGEFGTISNFRLGRLPKIAVEWDEINAAWGQACLLLHTMAQYFHPKFPYRIKIIPMGSYPRILDHDRNLYELFGPVNLFWSTRYDKAMTLFLTCLKDFADFAYYMDKVHNIPPAKCFRLPYKIENDRVENYTITQSFNKQESWTKALKYTLCNLKWALYWFVGNTHFQPLSSMVVPSKH